MKSFAKLAVAAVSGAVLLKLFATVIIPLLGMLFGLLALTVKLAVFAAVAYFVYSVFFKKDRPDEPNPDGEIVVEAEEVEVEGDES